MTHPIHIMPVIHHVDDTTSLRNAAMAAELGCSGIMLIVMRGADEDMDAAALAIKAAFPGLLVGTNRLRTPPEEAVRLDHEMGLDATWCDEPGISSLAVLRVARRIDLTLAAVRASRPDHLYFGSVAFKTHAVDPDPAMAALRAAERGWIATTSGPATGVAPDAEKLQTMKRALGAAPLAVASGITPENAPHLLPHVDWALVSTGISRSFHEFDRARLAALMAVAAGLSTR